ncbi:MAG: 2-dehydropantoate 2-reductase [Spirochaetales bacterium]|nr:2-dehydropantoate 2-reductase [Spirochaetales bacterium]
MKVSIIGAGAMGSLFGGKISKTGADVTLYDINKEHVDRINLKGLIIEEPLLGTEETVHPKATTSPEDLKDSDVFIIFVKSTVTETAAKQFSRYAKDRTIAVTMQNGLGNEAIIRSYFGADKTAAGVTSQGATFLGPGRIRHAGNGPTHLCMSDLKNEKIEPLVELFRNAGFEADIEENIQDLVWSKLIINVGINAVTALTGLKNGELLDYEETKDIMADLVNEACRVAEKKGIKLSYKNPLETVYDVAKKTALNRSSMLQDFDRKSRSEIDFINYAIVREGEELGIETPVNRTISGLVRVLDDIHRKEKGEI